MQTLALVILLFSVSAFSRYQGNSNYPQANLFILDTSGSMHGEKIEIAKQYIKRSITQSETPFGVIALGYNYRDYLQKNTKIVNINPEITENFKRHVLDELNKIDPSGPGRISRTLFKAFGLITFIHPKLENTCVNIKLISDGNDSVTGMKETKSIVSLLTEGSCHTIDIIAIKMDKWELNSGPLNHIREHGNGDVIHLN